MYVREGKGRVFRALTLTRSRISSGVKSTSRNKSAPYCVYVYDETDAALMLVQTVYRASLTCSNEVPRWAGWRPLISRPKLFNFSESADVGEVEELD